MKIEIEQFIKTHPQFTTAEFATMLRSQHPGMARSQIFNTLRSLCLQNKIVRISRGHFSTFAKQEYHYILSQAAQKVEQLIVSKYPLIDFQIWELYQLNEFVNHQISKNTLFIETEPMIDASVFELLFEQYHHVLLHPTPDDYYKYMGDTTIVVQRLISEAPANTIDAKQASLEKILVDIFCKGLPSALIEHAEYPEILETAFDKYNINQARLFRYARRRGAANLIREFIENKTDILLEVPYD